MIHQVSEVVIACFDDDDRQHVSVLKEAFDLFQDRTSVRGDMWRQFPASDKIRELRERVVRIENARNTRSVTSDEARRRFIRSDALDLINYAAFLIKQIDEGAEL